MVSLGSLAALDAAGAQNSASASVTASVQQPITVTKSSDLAFGSAVRTSLVNSQDPSANGAVDQSHSIRRPPGIAVDVPVDSQGCFDIVAREIQYRQIGGAAALYAAECEALPVWLYRID